MPNPFFKNHGPFKISDLIKLLNLNIENLNHDKEILDIKDLISSNNNDVTFFIQKNIKM